MSGCRSEAGRLLQILGPATEKLVAKSSVCSRNSEDVVGYFYNTIQYCNTILQYSLKIDMNRLYCFHGL